MFMFDFFKFVVGTYNLHVFIDQTDADSIVVVHHDREIVGNIVLHVIFEHI